MRPIFRSGAADKLLSDFSIYYENDPGDFIAQKILPIVKVKEASGFTAKFDKSNLRNPGGILRFPGTRARSWDYAYVTGKYSCQERALEKLVPWVYYKNTDQPYDLQLEVTKGLQQQIWIDQELTLATALQSSSVLTQNLNLTASGTSAQWDQPTSDPIGNINTARITIKQQIAKVPNCLMLSYDTFQDLLIHPDIVDRVKYVGTTDATAVLNAMKAIFQVQNIFVGSSVYNNANENVANSLGFIWNQSAILFYRPDAPTIMTPSLGYTIKDVDNVVDSYEDIAREGDVFRLKNSYDQNLTDVNAAYLFYNTVSN